MSGAGFFSLLIFCKFNFTQLKMLNRIATVKDDGIVVVNVPSTLEATPIDVGAVDGYEDVVVEESFCSQPLIS